VCLTRTDYCGVDFGQKDVKLETKRYYHDENRCVGFPMPTGGKKHVFTPGDLNKYLDSKKTKYSDDGVVDYKVDGTTHQIWLFTVTYVLKNGGKKWIARFGEQTDKAATIGAYESVTNRDHHHVIKDPEQGPDDPCYHILLKNPKAPKKT
jgi:hypothetical protein